MHIKRSQLKVGEKGLTLVETIVAIGIMTVGVLGPMELARQSISAQRAATDLVVASYLAQEGVETIINIRDNNSADDFQPCPGTLCRSEWLDTIVANCSGSNGCIVNSLARSNPATGDTFWVSGSVYPCSTDCAIQSRVFYDPTTGRYQQSMTALSSPWIRSPFSRVVGVSEVVAGQQSRVTATTTYIGVGGVPQTVVVTGDLYNWFPRLSCGGPC
jgi:Tfp pilus assembly protein PilV